MAQNIENITKTIDFSKEIGKIKPMHATGCGPVQRFDFSWDISNYFRAMNIPYSRLHDIEYPFGSGQFVDIHCVFPDFDADENDPKSYYFTSTDIYLKAMMDVGCKPFYRLGESIDHTPNKRFIHPPKDFKKWARVCEHIIRHYNEGWADGFYYDIEYWEIWNEPDSYLPGYNKVNMWTGTKEQYFELYRITSHHLKNCFGDKIKVGGYSCCNLNALIDEVQSERGMHLLNWANDFLDYISAEDTKSPLDFFSYHNYFNDPKIPYKYNNAVREFVDSKGFSDAEIIFTEWNIGGHLTHAEIMDVNYAADLAYIFLSSQKSATDMMMYYFFSRVARYNRVIGPDYEVYPAFYSFCMFGKLYELGTEVESGEYDPDSDVAMIAAKNDKQAGIAFANVSTEAKELNLTFKGLEKYEKFTVYIMDKDRSPSVPTPFYVGSIKDGLHMKLTGRNSIGFIAFE